MINYSFKEALLYLDTNNERMSESTLRRHITDGKIEYFYDKNKIYFTEEHLLNYINSRQFNRINDNAKIITFANHKGGVGKTVSVINVAGALADRKHKVLLLDFDPQANLSIAHSINITDANTIDMVLLDKCTIKDTIYEFNKYIDIIPSFKDLSLFERRPQEYILDLKKLSIILEDIRGDYDYILIDSPPQLSLLTTSAIIASGYLFIPINSDLFSFEGLLTFIEYARQEKPDINISGIFITRYNERRVIEKELLPVLNEMYPQLIMSSAIRETTDIAQAVLEKKSVIMVKPFCKASNDYRKLTEEILERINNE